MGPLGPPPDEVSQITLALWLKAEEVKDADGWKLSLYQRSCSEMLYEYRAWSLAPSGAVFHNLFSAFRGTLSTNLENRGCSRKWGKNKPKY